MRSVSKLFALACLLVAAVSRRTQTLKDLSFHQKKAVPDHVRAAASSMITSSQTSGWQTPRFAHRKPVASRVTTAPRSMASSSTAATRSSAPVMEFRDDIRNIAIVAHVDHGKTTLVDSLLEGDLQQEIGKDDRLMDGNDQEKERGITILAKNAAVKYDGIKINIVDTPGHADFGGEVERVLGMVDGVLLVVDAQEGPKPQTRFVLKKALALGLKVLVVINKIDKPASRIDYVIDKTFDLFVELGATDEQIDFPIIYASAVNRQSGMEPDAVQDNMTPLLKAIVDLPKPVAAVNDPLQLQISNVGSDSFIGRLGVGRIRSGTLKKGSQVGLSKGPGTPVSTQKITELFAFDAMGRKEVDEASAGDIVVFAGIKDFDIGDTVVDPNDPKPLDPIEVEKPTMSITMGVNKSPFAGKSTGDKLTSREIKERLDKELEVNVALKMDDDATEMSDTVTLFGRGLLHLTVLIENMRREGFELQVGPPKVLYKDIDGERHEPFELVDVELPQEFCSSAIGMLSERKGNMIEMGMPTPEGFQTVQFEVPSRAMVGVKSQLLSATKGLAVMTTTFAGYKPYAGDFNQRDRGNMLSFDTGKATSHGLMKAQERGALFSQPNDEVFVNQIIGVNSRPGDLKVNVCRTKQLTNMRSAGADEKANLTPPMELTLEDAVEYVVEGEFVEVTPETIRMGWIDQKKGQSIAAAAKATAR